MSAQATAWALSQRVGNSSTKLVLLVLADVASDEGYSYYSQRRLSEMAEMSDRTLRDHLEKLEDLNLLERQQRARNDGGRTSDGYLLNLRGTPRKILPAPPGKSCQGPRKEVSDPPGNLLPSIDEPLVEPLEEGSPELSLGLAPPSVRKRTKKTLLPDGLVPSKEDEAFSTSLGLFVDDEFEAFCDKARALGWAYADWHSAFRNWMRNTAKWADEREREKRKNGKKGNGTSWATASS